MMEQASHSGTVYENTLATLPIEILVFIVSFLSTRDKIRIRCVSKILRSASEVPSLWEDFVWSRYAPRDDKLLKHVLKMFGKYIKRIYFADHIAPSKFKVLKHCKSVVHLGLPSVRPGNIEKFGEMVRSMGSLQVLDILVPNDAFVRQVFTFASNLKELSLHYGKNVRQLSLYITALRYFNTVRTWLEEWANANCVPRKLNIISDGNFTALSRLTASLQACVPILRTKPLQEISNSERTAWVNIYVKTSTEISAAIPYIQLRVTDSSIVLSSVKVSKYGILGLDCDTLHLTEGIYRGRKVHKAVLTDTDWEYLDTSVASLISITHFDASCCGSSLYPGHLEQLSIACPNLQMLNLSRNINCLNNLEGLRSLANNCNCLQGLCLKKVHVHDHKCDCFQLWEILCAMHLTHLAIEYCMMRISNSRNAESGATAGGGCSIAIKHQKLVHMFQRCSSLHVLEVGDTKHYYTNDVSCRNSTDNAELLLIANFPSITSYKLGKTLHTCNYTLNKSFVSKLRCFFLSGGLTLSLEGHFSSLRQLYIESRHAEPTQAFIDALCDHGGLEHVILCFKSLTAESIENVIEHSSNLVTFRVFLCSRQFQKSQLKKLMIKIKIRFPKRRLFNGGNFGIQVCRSYDSVEVNAFVGTDLLSVWECHDSASADF